MARFPNTVDDRHRPLVGYSAPHMDLMHRTESEHASSQTRDRWGRLRFEATVTYEMGQTHAAQLYYEYESLRTSQFYFFDEIMRKRAGVSIGTGDGSTTIFTIPARSTMNVTVKVNNAPVAFTPLPASGPDYEDRVQIAAPANGAAVTADYTGLQRYLCEFASSPSERAGVGYRRVRLSFRIREVF